MIKQTIVIRTKYPDKDGKLRKIRTGKLMSQAAHASMKVFLDMEHSMLQPHPEPAMRRWQIRFLTEEMMEWLQGSFTKVCVGVKTEEELLDVYNKAKEAGLPCSLVCDSGKTEFNGVPTHTAVAVGPAKAEDIDVITGKLKLL